MEDGKVTKHPNLLLGTICDESCFKKSKAARSKFVEDLVAISIHSTDVSEIMRIRAFLQDERKA